MPTTSGLHKIPANTNAPAPGAFAPPASATDVQRLLGDVDAMIIARVLATNATVDEIGEALRSVEDESGFGEGSHEPSSPRVADVRAILDEMWALDTDDDEYDYVDF